MTPQFMPAGQNVMGVQGGGSQTFGVPAPPQTVPPVHFAVPQLSVPPQPFGMIPHWLGPQTVIGWHTPPSGPVAPPPPQTLGTPPPPQTCGRVHPPQLVVTPPQPFGCGPHLPG